MLTILQSFISIRRASEYTFKDIVLHPHLPRFSPLIHNAADITNIMCVGSFSLILDERLVFCRMDTFSPGLQKGKGRIWFESGVLVNGLKSIPFRMCDKNEERKNYKLTAYLLHNPGNIRRGRNGAKEQCIRIGKRLVNDVEKMVEK